MKRRKFIALGAKAMALLTLGLAPFSRSKANTKDLRREEMQTSDLDVLIIGGGPAGMSAALVLGRAMINTVIVNEEKPRNRVTQASHGFFTRDGYHPSELLEIAKKQLEQYETVSYKKGLVNGVEASGDGFKVTTEDGNEFVAMRIVFATGFKDNVNQIGLNGIEKVYGKTVFPCPFCDGWERRHQPLALFGQEEGVAHFAKTVSNWTNDLIVFTNGAEAMSETEKAGLEKNGIQVVADPIEEVLSADGQLTGIKLKSGEVVPRSGGFLFSTGEKQATDIPAKLGIETSDWGTYSTDDLGKTAVDRMYIIGDAKNNFTGVVGAASEGDHLAGMIVHEIAEERWKA